MVDEVTDMHQLICRLKRFNGSAHRGAADHAAAVAEPGQEVEQDVAAERIADDEDAFGRYDGSQTCDSTDEIIRAASVVIASACLSRRSGAAQIEPADAPPARKMKTRAFTDVSASRTAGQAVDQQDQRALRSARWCIDIGGETITAAVAECNLNLGGVAAELRRSRDELVAKRLKVATPPRKPILEVGQERIRIGRRSHSRIRSNGTKTTMAGKLDCVTAMASSMRSS